MGTDSNSGSKTPSAELESKGKKGDYEDAIDAVGIGKFNIILMVVPLVSIFTCQFEMASLAYVGPVAQCDLNLSLQDKGLLNSIVFAGMLASGLFWGPLLDFFGRRKSLITVFSSVCIFIVISSLASNFAVLLVAKFCIGVIVNGHSSGLSPYISEFHSKNYRSSIPIMLGVCYHVANVIIPLLAWVILPLDINFTFWIFEIKSWNLFLLVSILPAFLSIFFYCLLPETPRFTMTQGKEDKALKIFTKIYTINTGCPRSQYPISTLVIEKKFHDETENRFLGAWRQLSQIFTSEHAKNLLLTCLLLMCSITSSTTFRVWLPQLLQSMNDYEAPINRTSSTGTASFCDIIGSIQVTGDGKDSDTCTVNLANSSVYVNSAIVGIVAIVTSSSAAFIINCIGKKRISVICATVGSACLISLYFAPSAMVAIYLLCAFLACFNIVVDSIFSVMIDLFPTTLRASAISISLTFSRLGIFAANNILPVLLQAGCAPPIFTLGFFSTACIFLMLLLPNTDNKALV